MFIKCCHGHFGAGRPNIEGLLGVDNVSGCFGEEQMSAVPNNPTRKCHWT